MSQIVPGGRHRPSVILHMIDTDSSRFGVSSFKEDYSSRYQATERSLDKRWCCQVVRFRCFRRVGELKRGDLHWNQPIYGGTIFHQTYGLHDQLLLSSPNGCQGSITVSDPTFGRLVYLF